MIQEDENSVLSKVFGQKLNNSFHLSNEMSPNLLGTTKKVDQNEIYVLIDSLNSNYLFNLLFLFTKINMTMQCAVWVK